MTQMEENTSTKNYCRAFQVKMRGHEVHSVDYLKRTLYPTKKKQYTLCCNERTKKELAWSKRICISFLLVMPQITCTENALVKHGNCWWEWWNVLHLIKKIASKAANVQRQNLFFHIKHNAKGWRPPLSVAPVPLLFLNVLFDKLHVFSHVWRTYFLLNSKGPYQLYWYNDKANKL